ncbi:PAX-interacting protein 1 [Echinococcus granulosus]|nr:PAX-interacting protein 1 [Echinococcus granulosus]
MASSVFSAIRYYLIDSDDDKIVGDLKALGALKHPILSDSVKFAISDNGEAGEVGEAEDLYAVPVVTSQWVRHSLSKNSFLPFLPFHPNFTKTFKGVTAVISEVSLKDVVTLTSHLIIRGAHCRTVIDTKTTHLIIGRASGFLYERCKTHFPNVKMVSPDWVIECVRAQELLDCEKYNVELLIKLTLPKPPIMPKPAVAPVQFVEQSSQNLAPQIGGIGTSVPAISTSLENASGNLASRIISTNTGLVGFASGSLPVVSQPQVSTTFHQQLHHAPEPKPAKSSGKSKVNKHPSEQGLNEEQKHAIVMQNVKNILSQQANWNKDNSQNRGENGQMPGTFLPTGSTPIATGGTQRKPKSPKSPANRGASQAGGAGVGTSISKAGTGGQKTSKGSVKRTELAEIAVAPVASLGQPQQFTTVTVDASGGATQLFPHSTTATVLVATANPGVAQMTGTPRMPSTSQQNGAIQQTPAFLLQQQQHQQYQQQALIAAQNQFQKGRMASVGTPQQVQVSPLLLQGAQATPGQPRTATFIVRAPSAPDLQLGQTVTTTENVQALLEGSTSKEGLPPTATQQVLLQPGQTPQQQQLIQLQHQQQQQQKRVPSPSGSGGVLSPVFIQGRQPQPQQYKQTSGQMQIQVAGLQTQQQQQQQQPTIRPQPPRTAQTVRQALPPNHQGQQQYAQLAQQVKSNPQQHSHQLGQQQIIIQTSVGVQQVNAQYIGAGGAQMRAVASSSSAVQCASPRPPSIVGSPVYTQAQQALTSNGSASSILYHSSTTPATAGVPTDPCSATGNQQERVAYVASTQQQNQTQPVGGRLQPAVVQGQQIPQQQQQTVIGVSAARSVMSVAGAQASIIQTQHPQSQQAVSIQQGQFYGQTQPQTQPQQQQHRIIVQSPHVSASAQVASTQQHCMVSQSQLQGHIPQGGGNFIQQRQMLLQPQQVSSAGHPVQGAHAAVTQPLAPSARASVNATSQIRHMMAAAAVQQRHMVPPSSHYRSGGMLPTRPSAAAVGCGYSPSILRTQQQQQQLNAAAVATATGMQQPVPAQQSVPSIPPAFQLPVFRGHVGYSCPTAAQDCLIGCVMLIVGYQSFGEARKSLWKKIIRSYGAEVVTTYEPTRVTHIIMDWTLGDPDLYHQAIRDRKRLVTIYWLNDILAKGKLVPPYEIIHLPSAFAPGVSFSFIRSQVISITGFDGIERVKVETIIKQIGASFTDYLDQMNTILVCKRPQGKKYEMATVWGIPCVNLRWLQDIYLGDVSAMAADISHKYLCFDASDASIALETRTPRVQEIMVGWQQGISITPESWEHLAKLRSQLRQEEAEEEAAAALRRQQQTEDGEGIIDGEAEKRCTLPSLTAEEVERAKTGMLRETLLREESERVAAHRATAIAAAQQMSQQIPTSVYPLLYPVPSTPQYPTGSSLPMNHQLSTSAPLSSSSFPLVTMSTSHAPTPPPLPHSPSPATVGIKKEMAPLVPSVHFETEPHILKRPHSPPTANCASPPQKRRANDLPRSVPPHRVTASPDTIPRPASVGPMLETTSQPIKIDSVLDAPVLQIPEALSSTPATAIPPPTQQVDLKPPASLLSPLQPPSSQKPLLPSPTAASKAEVGIDTEVRLVFTGVDTETRLAIMQLLAQMPKIGIAPHRLVENVSEATHVITERLTRTPKIYMAVALGCPIVTAKWIQACLVRGDWLAEIDWLIEDAEAEENLGFRLANSFRIAHERRLLDGPGLFADLEFWFSPMAHHREVCEQLVRACGGRIRERRPTQKMALLPIPRQVIICHEEDSHVASYLMRTKTGNRAVHHEEFILSGVLRQELDFDSYQIQLVSIQFAELQAAISVANNNAPVSVRNAVARSQPEVAVAPPSQAAVYMRPPPSPPPAPSCVLLVSGAENQQSSVMYYISSGSTISSAPRALVSVSASSAVGMAATAATAAAGITASTVGQEEPLTLHLPEGISAVVVTGGEPGVHVSDEGLNAARVAAADAHVVASATAALTTTTNNPTLIADSGALVTAAVALGRSQVNCTPHRLPQQHQTPTPQPPSSEMIREE